MSLRYLTLCQNNKYKIPFSKKFFTYFIVCFLSAVIGGIISYFYKVPIFICLFFIAILIKYLKSKTKYKWTHRAVTTFVVVNIFVTIIYILTYILIKNKQIALMITYLLLAIYPLLLYIPISILNMFFEVKNKKFINEQKKHLATQNIIKIGITGSFGKTSVKNILTHLLSSKYKVLTSKSNYNTPMGLALTVNRLENQDIFVAEMGARNIGDISELVEFVKPNIGIITGVYKQHLETFKSLHNIYMEKQKLAKGCEKGFCVFNGNDKLGLKMFKEHSGRKIKVCTNKSGGLVAQNITINELGSNFEIVYKDKIFTASTILLGKHNIINILLATAVCLYLDIDMVEIVERIKTIKPISHRLELIKTNGINIIDDSYNSNIVGIEYALECLSKFGGRKVVMSQGLIELGKEMKMQNELVGKMIAQVADVVVLVGNNAKHIENGLNNHNYKGERFYFKSLRVAEKNFTKILKKGDTLLIQNDIPDTV